MRTGTDLLARFERLPASAGAAAAVLRLVDDPRAGAADLAQAIAGDPVFATRVLGLANSSYYGLSGTVATLPFAVSIIGFRAIRSLAVAAAAGLDRPDAIPADFWQVAATSAAAADLVAPLIGADPGDAFTIGLLHTFGAALLHQHHRLPSLCLPAPLDSAAHAAVELDLYGIGHAEAAARVLAAWQFPAHLTGVIAAHHRPLLESSTPLQRALAAARTLAQLTLVATEDRNDQLADLLRYTEGRLDPPAVDALIEHVRGRALILAACLQPV